MDRLRNDLAGFRLQARAILDLAKTEGRDLTDAEVTAIETHQTSIETTERAIERRDKIEALDKKLAITETTPPVARGGEPVFLQDALWGYRNAGEFCAEVITLFTPGGHASDKIRTVAVKEQGVPSTGGVLIPPAFNQTVWDRVASNANNLLAYTDNVPMGGSNVLHVPAIDETSRARGSRWGGFTGGWIPESGQMTATDVKLRDMKLELHKIYAAMRLSDDLVANAPALKALVTRGAADVIAYEIGNAIINGTGAGQPKGVMNSGALVTVGKQNNQPIDTVVPQNLVKMYCSLLPELLPGAFWGIDSKVLQSLILMPIDPGTAGVPVFLPPSGLVAAPNGMILGLPVRPLEYCAKIGDLGDVILMNLSMYATGTKGEVRGESSIHLYFDHNQTYLRFLADMDGQPWMNNTVTPANGGAAMGAFVTLEAR